MKIGEISPVTRGTDGAFGSYSEVTAPVKGLDDREPLQIRARRYDEFQTPSSNAKITAGRVNVTLESVVFSSDGRTTGELYITDTKPIESIIETSRSLGMAARRGAKHLGRINSVRMNLNMGHRS